MKFRDRLFSYKDPYDLAGSDALFAEAMRENCAYQQARNPEYARLLASRGFEPSMISGPDSLADIPVIPTAVFKKHRLATPGGLSGLISITATSSGTSGSMSVVSYDLGTLIQALKMAVKVTARRHLWSLKPCNYIVFGYKPHRGNRTAVTKTATGATLFAPALRRVYALKYSEGQYTPDLEGVIAAFDRLSKRLEEGELDPLIKAAGFDEAMKYKDQAVMMLRRESLEYRLARELPEGMGPVASDEPPSGLPGLGCRPAITKRTAAGYT